MGAIGAGVGVTVASSFYAAALIYECETLQIEPFSLEYLAGDRNIAITSICEKLGYTPEIIRPTYNGGHGSGPGALDFIRTPP